MDPSLDVFIATPDQNGAPAAITAIGSGTAEEFALNLTRKHTTKDVNSVVREVRMEEKDREAFIKSSAEAWRPGY